MRSRGPRGREPAAAVEGAAAWAGTEVGPVGPGAVHPTCCPSWPGAVCAAWAGVGAVQAVAAQAPGAA